VEYKVVTGNFYDFQLAVNQYLSEGWRPHGGVCFGGQYLQNYAQALVRETPAKRKTRPKAPKKTVKTSP